MDVYLAEKHLSWQALPENKLFTAAYGSIFAVIEGREWVFQNAIMQLFCNYEIDTESE
jgi:hypothetical protein